MKNKTVVIHQPDFAPYIGFFHRFLSADLYIVLDHVQFVKSSRGWTHRDKIKTPQGEKWLTLSVKKARLGTPINEILLSNDVNWRESHIDTFERNYKDTLYFYEIMPTLRDLYSLPCESLSVFNLKLIDKILSFLNINIPMVLSSELDPQGSKNQLLVDLLTKVDATHYLSGLGARDYFDAECFREAGVEVVWQDFEHPIYPQLYNSFVPYLSILDMLFNCGLKESQRILRSA